jgi:N6-L-threonylcarbamoyladenine synthase
MEKRIARKNPKDFSVLEKRYKKILEREPELLAASLSYLPKIAPPKIDAIAVTMGPGLEPALWVGINFAKTLSEAWQKPLAPINHMEGHIVSALSAGDVRFPALSLLVSGGHTELVLMKNWFSYKMLGATRDDAVGEAFDKTARLLGLPYPGGPEISRLAELHREAVKKPEIHLPRPMIDSLDFDFSFAGLKTAVRYLARDLGEINNVIRAEVAREFEDAAVETLAAKAEKAVKKFKPRTLIVAGGVSANIHLRRSLGGMIKNFPKTKLLVPDFSLSGDNAVMVAMAAYLRIVGKKKSPKKIAADGNLALR